MHDLTRPGKVHFTPEIVTSHRVPIASCCLCRQPANKKMMSWGWGGRKEGGFPLEASHQDPHFTGVRQSPGVGEGLGELEKALELL